MNDNVFVYGSLLTGLGNHHVLGDSELLEDGHIEGAIMYDYCGAFPGLRKDANAIGGIAGELYEVDAETMKWLDRLEGHPTFYCRERVDVHVVGGTVKAWVYFLVNEPRDSDVVVGGCWKSHLRQNV